MNNQRNPKSHKPLILIVLLTIFGFVWFLIASIEKSEIASIDNSVFSEKALVNNKSLPKFVNIDRGPIISDNPERITENGIRQDVEEKIFDTVEYKKLLKEFPSNRDKIIIKKLSLASAQLSQKMIDNADDSSIVKEAFKNYVEVSGCISILYGESGLDVLDSHEKYIINTAERKYLDLKAGKHVAFKITKSIDWSKNQCIEKFGE